MEGLTVNSELKGSDTSCCQNESAHAVSVTKSDSSVVISTPRSRTRSQASAEASMVALSQMNVSGDAGHESAAASQPSVVTVHYIATRSATGRLAKRPKREPSPMLTPPRKFGKDNPAVTPVENTSQHVHQRKLWSLELENLFFEGLFEHGKDFDAIQNMIVQKHKKLGDSDLPLKTKDQIRHFYYRTWNKMSKFIDRSGVDDAHKQALELFGVICYGEFRRKYGWKLDDKKGQKLNEMIHKGSTNIKMRGKNCRLKVPMCRALKKLMNIEDSKDREESREMLPSHVTIELRPRTRSAWARVQSVSKNPRLLIKLASSKRLSFVIDFLKQKWKFNLSSTTSPNDESSFSNLELNLNVPANCQLCPVSIRPSQVHAKVDLSFNNFMNSRKINNASSGAGTSPQNKRPNAKAVASLKTDDVSTQAKSAKLSSNSTVAVTGNAAKPQEADDNANTMADTAAVDISEAFQCLQTGSDAEQLQQAGVVEDNVEKSSVQKASDSSAVEAVVAAANSVQSAENMVISGCQSSTEAAAERIERLKQPIDRTAGQMFTLAELFLLMSRPERIQLEYDWTLQQPGGHGTSAAAADEIEKQMSNQLRKLVDIAVAQFAMMNKQIHSNDSLAAPSKLDLFMRSPRGRQTVNRQLQRSFSLSAAMGHMMGGTSGNVNEATIDQSANCSWPVLPSAGAASLPVMPSTSAAAAGTNATNYIAVASADGSGAMVVTSVAEPVVFRVPTNYPPRLQNPKPNVAVMPERTIVDTNTLQQHADLLMPRGRGRKLSRNVRRTLAQRALLPKTLNQLMPVSAAAGGVLSVNANSPLFLSTCVSSQSATADSSRPSVITMAPNEIRVRRIVPTPVAVQCSFNSDVVAVQAAYVATSSSSLAQPGAAQADQLLASQTIALSAPSTGQIPNAITGIDVFLHEGLQPGMSIVNTTLASSLLTGTDSNSMLDFSQPLPEASDMSDKLLDLALANSSNSFPGLLDSHSLNSGTREKEAAMSSSLATNSSTNYKYFKGTIGHLQQDDSWLASDVAMDLSLSSFLSDSPMKKTQSGTVSLTNQTLMQNVPASRICSLAAYTSGICSDSSRDSVILRDVDSTLQCMMNENSMDLASKFADLISETASVVMQDETANAVAALHAIPSTARH